MELEVARREGVYEEEGWRVRQDGSLFWASVVITALRDDEGILRGFAKITRDLTQRREEEQRLREHAQRMIELEEAKSNFLNLASHELRGPLTVIRGYLAMLADGNLGQLNDVGHEVLPVLSLKVDEMNGLIEQMLEVARMQEGRLHITPSEFDLRPLVAKLVQETRQLIASPEDDLQLRLPAEPVIVNADPKRISTILSNLVGNAIKYSPDGGRITVLVTTRGGDAAVTVTDEGIGIEPEDMETLFTRFGRIVKPETSSISGVGLGLYLSRELARLHGGDVTVVSQPGEGSAFTLTLPRA
jgi:signal transduction histidine kinase